MKKLRDVLPYECSHAWSDDPYYKLLDVKVTLEHFGDTASPWPGPQKNVYCWWELADGNLVGWNENPSHGHSYPVLPLTLKTVNRAIAHSGGRERLVKGEGYFYFINCGTRQIPSSGVYVSGLTQLTLDRWMKELEAKRKECA